MASWTGPSSARVREVLFYEPDTGEFYRRSTGRICDAVASHGYIQIYIDGAHYLAHHLAWLYIHDCVIFLDHNNQIKTDNRIDNLIPTTDQKNNRNRGVSITNMLGVKGVQQRGQKFRAYITVDRSNISLGTFWTLEEAVNARREAEAKYFAD